MDLSIIIVNWNGEKILDECLNSIKKNVKNIKFEVIVVDNDSYDNSVGMIKSKYPNFRLIESGNNLGFSKANNIGFNYSQGEYILFLNPDTIVLDDAIQRTLAYIKQLNKKCIVGCKLLNKDRSTQISSSKFLDIKNIIFGGRAESYDKHQISHETDWVMGAFMMIKNEHCKEIGGFSEDYFMYSEDMDICYKIKKNNGKVYYYADSEIVHLFNQSGAKKWSSDREKKLLEAEIIFYKKHYNFIKYITCKLLSILKFKLKKMRNLDKND